MMSNAMRVFLEAYLVFAETDGDENPYDFDLHAGLCSNSIIFVENSTEDYGLENRLAVRNELRDLLQSSGLDTEYPFGMDEYDHAVINKCHHKHQPRIEWIKEQLNAV